MARTYAKELDNMRYAATVLDKIKTTSGCVDCGFNAWPEALHFDHIDPQTKRASLGWVADRSKLKTKAKLKKFLGHIEAHCVIRCANCHAHRSKEERHWNVRREEHVELESTLF